MRKSPSTTVAIHAWLRGNSHPSKHLSKVTVIVSESPPGVRQTVPSFSYVRVPLPSPSLHATAGRVTKSNVIKRTVLTVLRLHVMPDAIVRVSILHHKKREGRGWSTRGIGFS